MLIDTNVTRSCINCGRDTNCLDTRTQMGTCNEDCRYDLWVESMYKAAGPVGENNEQWYD